MIATILAEMKQKKIAWGGFAFGWSKSNFCRVVLFN
jgi:hypothetical protein